MSEKSFDLELNAKHLSSLNVRLSNCRVHLIRYKSSQQGTGFSDSVTIPESQVRPLFVLRPRTSLTLAAERPPGTPEGCVARFAGASI